MDDKHEFNYLQNMWFKLFGNMDTNNIVDTVGTGLQAHIIDVMDVPKCPICIEEIINEKVTKCNHTFCEGCINKWLETNNSCPTCRTILIISQPPQTRYIPPIDITDSYSSGLSGRLIDLTYGQDVYLRNIAFILLANSYSHHLMSG